MKLEPFGYFKAEPFGWTDCAETDEGAQPLYDQPAIDLLTKQRDELLAAMELLVAGIENSVSETFIPLVKARAALASVKGGAA